VKTRLLMIGGAIALLSCTIASQAIGAPPSSPPPSDAPVIDNVTRGPATPRAVSGQTGHPVGRVRRNPGSTVSPMMTTYLRTTFDDSESLVDDGVSAYASTAAGTTALTGAVLNDNGTVISGASITLTPTTGGTSLSTTSDASGTFAFVDVPVSGASQQFNLTITASGLGTYSLIKDSYEANKTYFVDAELLPQAQTFDESAPLAESTLGTRSGSGGYTSETRVPPSIKVTMYPHTSGACTRASNTPDRVRNYPWKFYVLHVAVAEIDTRWGQPAWKANAAAIQNFAWFAKKQGADSTGGEIENTTNDQCFRPERKIPTDWKTWLTDVVDERIATSTDAIQQTQYRAGTYSCNESSYPADGNKLSQNGSRALNDNCGYTGFRGIDEYYYTGTVKAGNIPLTPSTSHSKANGNITFNFESTGGWRYNLQRYPVRCPDGTLTCWDVIHNKGWNWNTHNIPKSFTYTPPGGACYQYRVKAVNPVGDSTFNVYNSGNQMCP
jgi:Carboxypeptidase regulatory-like domain